MRTNNTTLRAMPYFRSEKGTKGKDWQVFIAPSVREFMNICASHASTDNERSWGTAQKWIGLGEQTRDDMLEKGYSTHAIDIVNKSLAKLPQKQTALNRVSAAITGGYWDTPSVIAGLPLSARARPRTKLTPLNLRIACFWSAGVSAEKLAPHLAKLARAIYDYTLAGGQVNLTVGFISDTQTDEKKTQTFIGCKVDASNLSALATILSPCGFRALGGRMLSAICDSYSNDTRGFNTDEGLPNTYWLNGCLEEVFAAIAKVVKLLDVV